MKLSSKKLSLFEACMVYIVLQLKNAPSVQLRLLIYKTTNVLYIYTGLEIQISFILIWSTLDLHGCCFCGKTEYS